MLVSSPLRLIQQKNEAESRNWQREESRAILGYCGSSSFGVTHWRAGGQKSEKHQNQSCPGSNDEVFLEAKLGTSRGRVTSQPCHITSTPKWLITRFPCNASDVVPGNHLFIDYYKLLHTIVAVVVVVVVIDVVDEGRIL